MNDAATDIHEMVRQGYAQIALGVPQPCSGPTPCCGGSTADEATRLAQAIGYSAAELQNLPAEANMGLSCGNPTALAALRPGEVVLDLGSGGGFDAFIAGQKVGAQGKVIGVDMTPEMLTRARRNLAAYRERTGLDNVAFRLGEIEHLPLADASVDVVLSNCVINLSPNKAQVWREIARVLKPGGRVAVSDIALLKPLPIEAQASAEALIGCIAGAVLVAETQRMVAEAGLVDAHYESKPGYIESMCDSSDPVFRSLISYFPEGEQPSHFITSLDIAARKMP